jgi:release factor glutamine methyltransferase
MKLNEANKKAIFLLQKEFIKNPALEARLIISYILNIDHKEFILNLDKKVITLFQWLMIKHKINKRLSGISMAYLIHKKFFYDSELFINRSVLVPRPETEILIDVVLQRINKNDFFNILEVGTGSGNISIELAKKIYNCRIDSIDKSLSALKVAFKNIKRNDINLKKITLIKKSIFDFRTAKKYDIIISNPPYIERKQVKFLIKNKIVSDPVKSLDGGIDGLKFYRKLKFFALNNLAENDFLLVEHGFDQKDNILSIFNDNIFSCETFKDLNNLDRAILIKRKTNYGN